MNFHIFCEMLSFPATFCQNEEKINHHTYMYTERKTQFKKNDNFLIKKYIFKKSNIKINKTKKKIA